MTAFSDLIAATNTIAARTDRLRMSHLTEEVYTRRDYQRHIHPEWSDPSDPAGNLLAEIADMHARRELLSPADERFLVYVIKRRIRTFRDKSQAVYLTDRQFERLESLTKRFTHQHLAERFLRIKALCGEHPRPGVVRWAKDQVLQEESRRASGMKP